jgi:hypothetical protein
MLRCLLLWRIGWRFLPQLPLRDLLACMLISPTLRAPIFRPNANRRAIVSSVLRAMSDSNVNIRPCSSSSLKYPTLAV